MLQNKVAKLIKKSKASDHIYYFNFDMVSPESLEFKSGQYINIEVAPNVRRSYSIGSPSYQRDRFELFIDISPGGPGSRYFKGLSEGRSLEFLGPIGMFSLDEDETNNILFVATGTGIAPLRSMYLDLLNRGYGGNITLVFGLRYIKDLFLLDEFEKLQNENDNFHYEVILSKPETGKWDGRVGHVQDVINDLKFNPEKTSAYICGNQKMIFDVNKQLEELGMKDENIHFEKFY